MKSIPGRLFNLQQDEINLVLFTLLHSFFIGLSLVFTGTAANTMFLINFEAKLLPLVYISSSVAVPLIGMLLIRAGKELPQRLLTYVVLFFLAGIPLLFLSLISISPGVRILSFILLVWVDAEIILSDLVFWTTANRLYNIRQAKRLFGLIGSGQVIAFIAGGVLIPLLVRRIDIPILLTVSSGGHICSLLILLILHRVFGRGKVNKAGIRETSRVALSGIIKEKYLRNIFMMVGLGYLVYYFVDLSFYDLSQSALVPGRELASFLGMFWAAVGLGNLFLRTVVYGRWTSATGIRGGLLAGPVLIGVGAVAAIIFSMAGSVNGSIFFVVVITKFVERVFINSMYVPSYFTLFQPFDDNIRDRLQNFTETVIGQGAGGIAGLFLLLLFDYLVLPPALVNLILFVIISVWLISILRISSGYRKSLAGALKTMGLKGREITLSERGVNYLEGELKDDNPMRVKSCLNILSSHNHKLSTEDKTLLINSPSNLVKQEVFSLLVKEPAPLLLPELLRHFNLKKSNQTLPGLVRAIGATEAKEAFKLLVGLLKSSNTALRDEGTLSFLLHFHDKKEAAALKEQLHEWTVSKSVKRRMSAAFVIPRLRDGEFIPDTTLLLKDRDIQVQKTAITSLSPEAVPVQLDTLLEIMKSSGLETEVIQAVSETHSDITQRLEAVYKNQAVNEVSTKACIIRIYKKQGTESNKYLLTAKLDEEDKTLRTELLHALQSTGYKAQSHDAGMLLGLLESEKQYCYKVFSSINVLEDQADSILIDALYHEVEKSVERIFIILSFLYTDEEIIVVLNNLNTGSAEKRAFALELADTLIRKKHKPLVFPIIDENPIETKIRLLEKHYRTLRLPDRDKLLEDIGRGLWRNSWLETCVRYLKKDANACKLVQKVQILKNAQLFSAIPDEKLASLAPIAKELRYPAGERIITKGETGTSMYIVAEGRVKAHDGDTVLAEIEEGSFFGELAALSPEPRSASITGITPTRILNIEQEALINFLKSNLDVGRAIILVLCLRIRNTMQNKESQMPDCRVVGTEKNITTARNDEMELLRKFLALKSNPVFHDLPDKILTEAADRENRLIIGKGHTLYNKNKKGSRLWLVAEGEFEVESNGKLVQKVGKNGILGELSALDAHEREGSALAACDAEVIEIRQSTLFDLMWNQYDVVEGLLQVLITRLRELNRI
jgi:AAA family ATP:ADP antiporter